jgi:hypothetical protein
MKQVDIFMTTRDENGEPNGSASMIGTTEDDGLTVQMPLGYLPGIQNAQPGDIVRRVLTVNTTESQPGAPTVTPDTENGVQTLTFPD